MTNSIRPVVSASLLDNGEAQDAVIRSMRMWVGGIRSHAVSLGVNPTKTPRDDDRWVETEWWEDFNKDAKRSARNQVGVQSRACRGEGCLLATLSRWAARRASGQKSEGA